MQTAYVLHINSRGEPIQRGSFSIDTSHLSSIGAVGLIRILGDRVFVAVNRGALIRVNPWRKNVLGWPPVCFEDASIGLFEFDRSNLVLQKSKTIGQFQLNAMEIWNNRLFIGGEALDDCTQRGVASVLKLDGDGSVSSFWKDDGVFPSAVKAILVRNGLEIAVNFERAIGINVVKSTNLGSYDKRYGDDNMAIREGSLIDLSPNGGVESRLDFTTGLSVYLTGMAVAHGKLVAYGSLGGEPASTLH